MDERSIDRQQRQARRAEYVARVDRVIDYVETHLDEELSLEKLASVASFSRFHFHRIFRAVMGETLHQFIARIRVERAALQLVSNPTKSITDVAYDCGFSGPAPFARAFREAYGMTASDWRADGHVQYRKNRQANRKDGKSERNGRKDRAPAPRYGEASPFEPRSREMKTEPAEQLDATFEVKQLPELTVAYVRHVGPYQGDAALFARLFEKLMKWAGPRDLLQFPATKLLSVYHDDPELTDADRLRTSACISVPEDTEVDGDIGKMTVPGGKFVVAHFEIEPDQYAAAWDTVMGSWMPESGYQPDDRLCYELFSGGNADCEGGKHVVDICVPVKPL